jgi:hypothetical protein
MASHLSSRSSLFASQSLSTLLHSIHSLQHQFSLLFSHKRR